MKKKSARRETARDLAEALAVASPSILYVFDARERRNVFVSAAIERILGYTPEEIEELGSEVYTRLVHPEDRHQLGASLEWLTALPDGEWVDTEYRMRARDGRWRWLRSRQTVFERARDGAVLRTLGSAEDITEAHLSLLALEESEARFRSLANTAPVLIWMAGSDGQCTFFNQPWLDFTGRSLERELGEGWTEGVHPEDRKHCLGTYRAAFDHHDTYRFEYRLRHHGGEYRWVLNSGVPRFNDEGYFEGYIGSCIDITDSKRAETALRESEARFRDLAEENARLLERAREEARAKSLLLEEINHRVKNNLATILGILSLESERARELGEGASHLLDDLMGRIQALTTVHEMLSTVGWAPVSVADLLGDVAESVIRGAARNADISLRLRPPEAPIHLAPNRATALALIANELATNALKYAFVGAAGGTLDIRVEVADRGGGEPSRVTVLFRDDGPGWPEDVLAGRRENIGLRLVRVTAQSPLRSTLRLYNDGGAAARLTFALTGADDPAGG